MMMMMVSRYLTSINGAKTAAYCSRNGNGGIYGAAGYCTIGINGPQQGNEAEQGNGAQDDGIAAGYCTIGNGPQHGNEAKQGNGAQDDGTVVKHKGPTMCVDASCLDGIRGQKTHAWWIKKGFPGRALCDRVMSIGGIAHDAQGKFLFAFSGFSDIGESFEAELRAIRFGFEEAARRGIKDVRLESDNLSAVNLVNSKNFPNPENKQIWLIDECKKVLRENPSYVLDHNPRLGKMNIVADILAKAGQRHKNLGEKVFSRFPPKYEDFKDAFRTPVMVKIEKETGEKVYMDAVPALEEAYFNAKNT